MAEDVRITSMPDDAYRRVAYDLYRGLVHNISESASGPENVRKHLELFAACRRVSLNGTVDVPSI